MSEPEKNASKGLTATNKMILAVVALVAVCATVVAVVYMLRPQPQAETGGAQVITQENVSDIEKEVAEKVAKGMFETHMNTTWTFPDGKSPSSDAIMGNAESNNYDFYFTVTLPDTGEVIFTSGLIPVGSEIAEIKLEKELSAGTYSAVVTINMVDENGESVDSNMGINVTLVVEN